MSGTFQARPGISIGSTYTFNSAQAGFALTGGGTLSVTVVDPTTQYYDYVKTLDGRVAKSFRFGSKRLQPFMEIFNLPNSPTVLTVNETVGPLYFNPQAIIAGTPRAVRRADRLVDRSGAGRARRSGGTESLRGRATGLSRVAEQHADQRSSG